MEQDIEVSVAIEQDDEPHARMGQDQLAAETPLPTTTEDMDSRSAPRSPRGNRTTRRAESWTRLSQDTGRQEPTDGT